MDQLHLEKKNIPTVMIATSAFEEVVKSIEKEQGTPDLALVVVEHPIAGHNEEEIRKKADAAFPEILKMATGRQLQQK